MANVSLEQLAVAINILNQRLEAEAARRDGRPATPPNPEALAASTAPAADPKAEQLNRLATELDQRGSLTVAEAARVLSSGIKTASRRLKELARLGRAHVYFEPHGYTVHLRAVHPSRAAVDPGPGTATH